MMNFVHTFQGECTLLGQPEKLFQNLFWATGHLMHIFLASSLRCAHFCWHVTHFVYTFLICAHFLCSFCTLSVRLLDTLSFQCQARHQPVLLRKLCAVGVYFWHQSLHRGLLVRWPHVQGYAVTGPTPCKVDRGPASGMEATRLPGPFSLALTKLPAHVQEKRKKGKETERSWAVLCEHETIPTSLRANSSALASGYCD